MSIRLSHSTLDILGQCERKFQIERLLSASREGSNVHFEYGSAFGVGVASFLVDQDPDKALYCAWMEYDDAFQTDKKSTASMLYSVERAFPMIENILQEYEIVFFRDHKGQKRPATELSFRIIIDEEYYYVGYIDAILRNKYTNKCIVLEVKTTGLNLTDLSPLYRHSGQAIGYSIVLDQIVGRDQSEYGVLYLVDQIKSAFEHQIKPLLFNKNILDRLNWFMFLGLEISRISKMREINVFPRRYTGCLKFNKACYHFGTCHLHSFDIPRVEEEDTKEYAFTYLLDDILADHLERVKTFVPSEPEALPPSILEI